MSSYFSPLRYPGGKTSLLKFLANVIHLNSPIDTYVEPFAGGAGAALGLLFKGYVKNIILNDSDEFIFKLWDSILNKKTRFINKIIETQVTIERYKKIKEILLNPSKKKYISDLEIGFTAFYLNRCNRSGILRSGPIGGHEQTGKWKIDARFNKKDLIERIEKIYNNRDSISLHNEDAISFMRNTLPNLGLDNNKTFVYLDPPYFKQGPELYRTFYTKDQHRELNQFLMHELNIKWVLSYDDVQQINELYNESRINGYQKSHFINKAKIGKELIIISDNCLLPSDYE